MNRLDAAVQRDLASAPEPPPVMEIEHRARRRRAREVAAGCGTAVVVGALVIALLVANGSNAPVSVRTLTTPPPSATTSTTGAPAKPALPFATRATIPDLDHILSIVQGYAAGDGPVESGEVVATTTDKMIGLFGFQEGSRPIYLVRLRGHFVCNGCSIPSGAKAPSGDEILFVVPRHAQPPPDSAFEIGDRVLDLSIFGRAYRLPLATARIELPSKSMRSGASMTAQIVVENIAGRALTFDGCGPLYQVFLENDHTGTPLFGWETCLAHLAVPAGESRYSVVLRATTLQAANAALPPGEYRAVAFAQNTVLPIPPPVAVRVRP